ncbi:MAG TPA: hypothetical protein VFY02_09450 [Gaiellaceae bacterium]|nr:hypothetical protein [Gaiellaceae bacterium]
MSRSRARIAVALLVTASAAVRFAAARGVEPGWIAPDEAIYSLLGRSLWESGDPTVLGSGGYHALVYPALVGLPLTFADLATGLTIVQALQAIAVSATAAVAYLWGRRPLGEGWAVVAAALVLAIPGLAYVGLLMPESLRYLVVTVALAALAASLERPSLRRQGLAGAAIALAVLTHLQALALVPAVFVAVGLMCVFERRLEPARRLTPLLGGLVAIPLLVLGAAAVRGGWRDAFGAYAAALGGYDLGAVASDVAWHAGGLFLVVAGIPLLALALMLGECLRRTERAPAATALVATATAWTLCLLLEIGIFASRWVGHIAERGLLSAAPPLFLVFGLWLARGLPRPRGWTQAAALAVAAPAVLLPVTRFAVQEAALDAFAWVPLWRLAEATSPATLEVVFPACAALLVAAAVVVPAGARAALPALAATVLVTLSVFSSREVARLTQLDIEWVFGTAEPRWVDAAANGSVTYLHGSEYAAGAWKHLFWNRKVDAVVTLPDTVRLPPLEPATVSPRFDGLLLRTDGDRPTARLVVAPAELELAGQPISAASPSTDLNGLTLWQADTPLRVVTRRDGFQPNGDIDGAPGIVTVFGCGPGQLQLTLLGKAGAEVSVTANEIPRRQFRLANGDVWIGSIAAPPDADGRAPCVFSISSPGLVGSTVVEWAPATP